MNSEIQEKLAKLTEDAGEKGPAAVYAVLQLLQDCLASGTARDFAEHCCRYSPAKLSGSQIQAVVQSSQRYLIN